MRVGFFHGMELGENVDGAVFGGSQLHMDLLGRGTPGFWVDCCSIVHGIMGAKKRGLGRIRGREDEDGLKFCLTRVQERYDTIEVSNVVAYLGMCLGKLTICVCKLIR